MNSWMCSYICYMLALAPIPLPRYIQDIILYWYIYGRDVCTLLHTYQFIEWNGSVEFTLFGFIFF